MASEPARARLLWDILSLVLLVTFGHTTACHSPALAFSAAINFAMKRSASSFRCPAPFPLVQGGSRPLVGVDAESSERSSRKRPIYSFSWPPRQPAPPTNSPNITHFGSLVSSMRATNPANKIRLLCEVASMPSLPVLISSVST